MVELPRGDEEVPSVTSSGSRASSPRTSGSRARNLFTEHHQAHAAAAFLTAPTRDAAILTADGVGEWTTFSVGRGTRSQARDRGGAASAAKIEILREIRFPHSLGMLYSTFTAFLGFAVNEGEYKVMGLASYGEPRFVESVKKDPPAHVGRRLRARHGVFRLPHDVEAFVLVAIHRRVRAAAAPLRAAQSDDARRRALRRHRRERAARPRGRCSSTSRGRSTRRRDAPISLSAEASRSTAARTRASSASPASSASSSPSAPGDAGCALGAALYADRVHFGQPDRSSPTIRSGDRRSIRKTSPASSAKTASRSRSPMTTTRSSRASPARFIAAGSSAGWVARRSSGRARSATGASSRRRRASATRDRLNKDIKYREEFRPFAPAVPSAWPTSISSSLRAGRASGASCRGSSRSGRSGARVWPRSRTSTGRPRPDRSSREMAPRFHALLEAYGELSGVPILLNTSFNLAGEPIVCRAREGYSTFRRCGDRSARRRANHDRQGARARRARRGARSGVRGGKRMLKRRGRIVRGLLVIASAVPSIVNLARGMWKADTSRDGSCRSQCSSARRASCSCSPRPSSSSRRSSTRSSDPSPPTSTLRGPARARAGGSTSICWRARRAGAR